MRQSAMVWTLVLGAVAATAYAQGREPVPMKPTDLGNGVHMLEGAGGNLAVSAGDDGVFIVDDQFDWQAGEIGKAVKAISEDPVKFVINTHWHGDHTGGNEHFGLAGAIIVAHENVRKRMSTEQFMKLFGGRKVPASPKAALPVVTFAESITLHLNGDEVHVFHVDPGHTDGDSIVHFKKADVIHMGDLFFNGIYPFIDTGSGGSVAGVIAAADEALKLVGDKTQIIPGHGPLAKRADLEAFRDMLKTLHGAVAELVAAGKTKDEVIAAKPSKDLDAKWGKGFMRPDAIVGIVFDSVSAEAKGD